MNLTSCMRMAAYGFERGLLDKYLQRRDRLARTANPQPSVRASLLGVEAGALSPDDEPRVPPSPLPPAFEFEQRMVRARPPGVSTPGNAEEAREARLVRFFDSAWAYLTEWHSVPRVTRLVEEGASAKGSVERVLVSEINPGDYLLFREGGDKDIIRLVAENEIGESRYVQLRSVADLWKSTLNRIVEADPGGAAPSVIRRALASRGLHRTEMTIRHWLWNNAAIGPSRASDLHVIAEVAGDQVLVAKEKEVWDAIQDLRGLHVRAGFVLTKLLLKQITDHISEIGSKETRLDLVFGAVWVCQVAFVAPDQERVAASIVNRLMWNEAPVGHLLGELLA